VVVRDIGELLAVELGDDELLDMVSCEHRESGELFIPHGHG